MCDLCVTSFIVKFVYVFATECVHNSLCAHMDSYIYMYVYACLWFMYRQIFQTRYESGVYRKIKKIHGHGRKVASIGFVGGCVCVCMFMCFSVEELANAYVFIGDL